MELQIFRLDNEDTSAQPGQPGQPVCTLQRGEHFLGRGELLKCTDKTISRKHISIIVEEANSTLSLVQHDARCNECFYKPEAHNKISVLTLETPISLNDNDTFGFFLEKDWFRIHFHTPEQNPPAVEPSVEPEVVIKTEIKEEPEAEPLGPSLHENPDPNDETLKLAEEIKEEPTLSNDPNQPSCSNNNGTNNNNGETSDSKKTCRDHCWYGKGCYRKNPEHTTKYSHLGDADYDTDPEDNRPVCMYRRHCYRRNSEHRRDYQHSNTKQVQAQDQPQNPQLKRPVKDGDADGAKNKKRARKDNYYNDESTSGDDDEPFSADDEEDYFGSD